MINHDEAHICVPRISTALKNYARLCLQLEDFINAIYKSGFFFELLTNHV